jgi:hypothetical protein
MEDIFYINSVTFHPKTSSKNLTNKLLNLNSFGMEEILIPLAFFATIVLIVYIFYANRNKERLALINKSLGAEIFNQIPQFSMVSFKIGFLLIGLGIGSLVGNILAVNSSLHEGVSYFSMIMLFGGASLIISQFVEKRMIQNYKKLN